MNIRSFESLSSQRAALAVTALGWLAAACGGGAPVQENPVTSAPPPAGYSGPPPASQDVQSFKLNVWDNLQANNRCGSCHGEVGQAPSYVRRDDINLAYQAANGIDNLNDPRRGGGLLRRRHQPRDVPLHAAQPPLPRPRGAAGRHAPGLSLIHI